MIFYAGNKLACHGKNPTTIDTLGPLLSKEFKIFTCSSKTNKIYRLLDIIYNFVKFKKDIKIVLIDTYSTLNFIYAISLSILCKLYKKKYILFLHGGNLPEKISKNNILTTWVFKNSYMLISPSLYIINKIEKYGYNPIYIPNNIEIEKYNFKTREIITPKIIYVRAFSKIYNPKMALLAFNEVLKVYPDAELCMIGPIKDNSYNEFLELSKNLNINNKIKITGQLTKQQWHKLSENYNIFINTTNVDNMPVSLIEAMALGIPIVSTAVGGIPYLIDNNKNGILVQCNNYKQMADKIIYLAKNRNCPKNLAINARIKANEFSWNEIKLIWTTILK